MRVLAALSQAGPDAWHDGTALIVILCVVAIAALFATSRARPR